MILPSYSSRHALPLMSTYSEQDIQEHLNTFHDRKTTLIYPSELLHGFQDTVEKYQHRTVVSERTFHAKVSGYIVLFCARKMHKS